MNDAEFRKRAHALLASIDERWREEIGPVDLDSCAECGKHGAAHKSDCDLAALLAAGEALSPNERAERRFGLYAGPCDCGAVGHVASCSAMKFPVAATIAPLAGVVHVAPDASQVVGHGDACPRCGAFRNPFFPALHDKGCR